MMLRRTDELHSSQCKQIPLAFLTQVFVGLNLDGICLKIIITIR